MTKKHRAFLKWAGGKFSLVDTLRPMFPEGKRFVEPFVGAGSVFLNTDYEEYVLNDINQDLINLYLKLKSAPIVFIDDAKHLFTQEKNCADAYYEIRKAFNATDDPYQRSLYFLYLNRHGYNGLCRYNKSGGYNVPFGKYKKPYFPEAELLFFAEKSQRATFTCLNYRDVFERSQHNDVIYCDPPYVPLSKTSSFTSYASNGFGLDEQADLANAAEEVCGNKKVTVLISNHNTIWTRKIYGQANKIKSIKVARTISQKAKSRKKVGELIALYQSAVD